MNCATFSLFMNQINQFIYLYRFERDSVDSEYISNKMVFMDTANGDEPALHTFENPIPHVHCSFVFASEFCHCTLNYPVLITFICAHPQSTYIPFIRSNHSVMIQLRLTINHFRYLYLFIHLQNVDTAYGLDRITSAKLSPNKWICRCVWFDVIFKLAVIENVSNIYSFMNADWFFIL